MIDKGELAEDMRRRDFEGKRRIDEGLNERESKTKGGKLNLKRILYA